MIASALIIPSKRLKDLKLKTVKKKFRDKSFARGSSRVRISTCEAMGVPREKMFEIALNALKNISEQLGL
jgi:predicted hydrolase (HD superfamily)